MFTIRYFYYPLWGMLISSTLSCEVINTPPLRSELNLKHNYSTLRSAVNQIRKYTGSKRPLSDQEWREFKATTVKIGKIVSAIGLAIGGTGTMYYIWNKKAKKNSSQLSGHSGTQGKTEEAQKELTPLAQFEKARSHGDWYTIIDLLKQGFKVSKDKWFYKGNILHEMIMQHPTHPIDTNIKAVLTGLKDQIDVNEKTLDEKESPLFMVMHQIQQYPGYFDTMYHKVLDLLIDAGADKDEIGFARMGLNSSQGTLLHATHFIRDNEPIKNKVIQYLLHKGVDPSVRNSNNRLYTEIGK